VDDRLEPAARAGVAAGRLAPTDRVCYKESVRARVAMTVLWFFAALVATGTPSLPASAATAFERTSALGGETERTPYLASTHATVQLRAAREAQARPAFAKLPPQALTLRSVALAAPSALARAIEVACTPTAPPSAPRSCRGPPRAT